LKKRGRKNAPFMGKIVGQLGFLPDLIISSPASRAAMTTRIFASKIKYPLKNIRYLASIYESDEINLMQILKELDDNLEKVMLVGHNPAITHLANKLSNSTISNIPTSGVFCIALNILSWSGIEKKAGELKYFEFPKKHE